jgi:hypothetical protein
VEGTWLARASGIFSLCSEAWYLRSWPHWGNGTAICCEANSFLCRMALICMIVL